MPTRASQWEITMRHLITASVAACFLFVATPATACDRFDRVGWTCGSIGMFNQSNFKKRRVMSIGYARGVHSKLNGAYKYVSRKCRGVRVVSGVRRTYVRGGRRGLRSLHWTGNALDFRASSYRCAYAALRSYGWRYGMSRDGSRCRHIHISYGGPRRERNGFRHYRC